MPWWLQVAWWVSALVAVVGIRNGLAAPRAPATHRVVVVTINAVALFTLVALRRMVP